MPEEVSARESSRPKLLVAQLNARAGQDQAFNAWYDQIHAPDILAMAGADSMQRFVRAGPPPSAVAGPDHQYLALVEVSDEAALTSELNESYGTDRMRSSDAVDPTDPAVFFFEVVASEGRSEESEDLILAQFAPSPEEMETFVRGCVGLVGELPGVSNGRLIRCVRHWRFADVRPAWPVAVVLRVTNAKDVLSDLTRVAGGTRVTHYRALTPRLTAPSRTRQAVQA